MAISGFLCTRKHFFKPILPGSFKELSIPKGFVKYLDEDKCEGEAILKSNRSNGKAWRVKVNGFRFQQGWNDFVRDHDLQVKDLLVFGHEGGMVFNVMVFDASACERVYPPLDFKPEDQMEEKEESGGRQDSKSAKNIPNVVGVEAESKYFTTTIKRYNVNRPILYISKEFGRSHGLKRTPCIMILRDKNGRSWQVNLRHRNYDGKVYISGAGWLKFFNDNGLREGDVCTFKLISRGLKPVMEVTISLPNST